MKKTLFVNLFQSSLIAPLPENNKFMYKAYNVVLDVLSIAKILSNFTRVFMNHFIVKEIEAQKNYGL